MSWQACRYMANIQSSVCWQQHQHSWALVWGILPHSMMLSGTCFMDRQECWYIYWQRRNAENDIKSWSSHQKNYWEVSVSLWSVKVFVGSEYVGVWELVGVVWWAGEADTRLQEAPWATGIPPQCLPLSWGRILHPRQCWEKDLFLKRSIFFWFKSGESFKVAV